MKKIPLTLTLTAEQTTAIVQMLHKTWSYINCDLPERMTVEDAVEVVLDADYAYAYGGDQVSYALLQTLPYEQQEGIARQLFGTSKWV